MRKIVGGVLLLSVILFGSIESEIEKERFERKNGTLIDHFAKMQWQDNKDAHTKKLNWDSAVSYCRNLNLDNKKDWRLPDIDDLKQAYRIKSKFKDYALFAYWSSTSDNVFTYAAKYVYFNSNAVASFADKKHDGNIRCVRGNYYNSNRVKSTIESKKNSKHKALFDKAKEKNTIQSYKNFIKECKNAPQVKEAQQNVYKLAYNLAKSKNTMKDYEEFIKEYPKASQVKEAQQNIYKIAYGNVKKQNNIAGYEWFIKEYPKAPQVKEALSIVHELVYEEAEDIDTISAYNTFIIAYPTAPQVIKANENAKDLEYYKYTDTLPSWFRAIMPDFLASIFNGIFGIFSDDEKKSRALLIKAKQIEQHGNGYYGHEKDGYIIITNRMYDLLQEEFDDTDATLRHLESQEFKDFVRTFKNVMSSINRKLENIASYSSELLETSKKGFEDANADREMAAYKQEQHTKWEKLMHFKDKGYQ